MAILEHPAKGSILVCDFDQGFVEPEMVKRRPVIVISPKIHARPKLCTIVALSATAPDPVMPYHAEIEIVPPLPPPFDRKKIWVKGDMVNAVGFHRLNLIRTGNRTDGKRNYYFSTLNQEQMSIVQACVLRGLGLSGLTKYL